MDNAKENRSSYHTFAALKLIEALYHDKKISRTMYRGILRDYKDQVDLSQFP